MSKEDKMVSVVLPVYNGEDFLSECVSSVINQSYNNIEIIIVNDGSKDGSKKIIKEYERKENIYLYENKENKGIPYSRNKGIKKSKGEFIAFIDQDDIWKRKKIESQVHRLNRLGSNVGVVGTSAYICSKEGNIVNIRRAKKLPSDKKKLRKKIYKGGAIITASSLIRRKCFDKVGLLNENRYGCDDLELWMEISKHWFLKNIHEPLLISRKHGENAGKSIDQFYDTVNLSKDLPKEFPSLRDISDIVISDNVYRLAVKLFRMKKYREAIYYCYKSIRKSPVQIKPYIITIYAATIYVLKICKKNAKESIK